MCYDAIIIGGGVYGCSLALHLKNHMDKVLILEREAGLLQRASYANQARVHNGYHYPRSFLTALRSRVNFTRFVDEHQDCVDQTFEKYYAIGSRFSKVTAAQFKIFCKRIGIPLEPAPKTIRKLFNHDLIEDVFLAREYAFDSVKLKTKLLRSLLNSDIELKLNCHALRVSAGSHGILNVNFRIHDEETQIAGKRVFNCTYSRLNEILSASALPLIPLRQELTELALVAMPAHMHNIGITVMDGPFFSIMPFPPRGFHTFSHVRYTVHYSWNDGDDRNDARSNAYLNAAARETNYPYMIRDAQRYLPALKNCLYIDSLWETKTVLPTSEVDDSRPILFLKDHGLKNFTCILGGKIDNIYDMGDELESLRLNGGLN